MIAVLQAVLKRSMEQLTKTLLAYGAPLLAGLVILAAAWLLAACLRWVLNRIFKGAAFDRFLTQSGLSSMFGRSRRVRATHLVSGTVYWAVLLAGALAAISAFDGRLTSQIIESAVFLLPKALTAGVILLAGAWLAQYLGRSVLVWACNEGVSSPRTWSAAVRIMVLFVAVVAAADHLNFARSVFLAAFIILGASAGLAAALAVGLGAHDAVARRLKRRHREAAAAGGSLWNHL